MCFLLKSCYHHTKGCQTEYLCSFIIQSRSAILCSKLPTTLCLLFVIRRRRVVLARNRFDDVALDQPPSQIIIFLQVCLVGISK